MVWLVASVAAGIGLAVAVGLYLGRRPGEPPPRAETRGMGRPIGPTPRQDAPKRRLPPGARPIQLQDVTGQTGIAFTHTDGGSGKFYIMEAMSCGLALVDYDGDGLIDVYFPNGAPLPGTRVEKTPHHALYRNLGGWKFRDVTAEAGVACTAFGLGVTVGDYDNDGHPDIYLSNFGPNVLYRNNGDGTFTDVTDRAGVARGNRVGAGVCLLDCDNDGLLDLFVSNYVQFSYQTHRPSVLGGVPFYPGPLDHPPETNNLFRNNGDGTFTDVGTASGVARHAGTGMGTSACDYDNDGDTDVFVANDMTPNFLFRNDGQGGFEEVAIPSGVAYNGQGMPQASMGADFGDYDRDGWLDLYVTSYQNELATLLRNLGQGLFLDVTQMTGAGDGTLPYVTWGCAWVDLDNDGDRDLFVACGHTEPNVRQRDKNASYPARNLVLRNLLSETGKATFANVTPQCGDGLRAEHVGRGAAFDDLDNDGDVDVVILNLGQRPTVLRNMLNESGSPHHWLQVRLQGVKTNRDGVGARVCVVAGDLVQVDEVHSGRGYQSHWGSRLHFGLGNHQRVDRIEVRWIGGGVDVLENVAPDKLLTITEGTRGRAIRD